jgi:hypothetical protein
MLHELICVSCSSSTRKSIIANSSRGKAVMFIPHKHTATNRKFCLNKRRLPHFWPVGCNHYVQWSPVDFYPKKQFCPKMICEPHEILTSLLSSGLHGLRSIKTSLGQGYWSTWHDLNRGTYKCNCWRKSSFTWFEENGAWIRKAFWTSCWL